MFFSHFWCSLLVSRIEMNFDLLYCGIPKVTILFLIYFTVRVSILLDHIWINIYFLLSNLCLSGFSSSLSQWGEFHKIMTENIFALFSIGRKLLNLLPWSMSAIELSFRLRICILISSLRMILIMNGFSIPCFFSSLEMIYWLLNVQLIINILK